MDHLNLLHSNESCLEVNKFFAETDYTTYLSVQVTFGVLYSILFIVGILLNLSVIVKIASKRRLQTTRNIFIVGLMVSDTMLCLTAVPISPVAAIMKRWIFGAVMCALIPLCQTMCVVVTSYCLTSIALDKYIHIIYPTQQPITRFICLSIIFVIWMCAFSICIPLVLSYELFDGVAYKDNADFKVAFCGYFCDETAWQSEHYQRTFGTFIMIIQFIIPMIVITFCYSRILKKVDKDMLVKNKRYSTMLSKAQLCLALKRKRRVNYILIMMVVTFFVCWLPISLYNILRDYEQLPWFVERQPYLWFLIVHSIAMTMIVWNPLLFFWLTKSRKKKLNSGLLQGILSTAVITWNPMLSVTRRRSTMSSDQSQRRGTQYSDRSPSPRLFRPLSRTMESSTGT